MTKRSFLVPSVVVLLSGVPGGPVRADDPPAPGAAHHEAKDDAPALRPPDDPSTRRRANVAAVGTRFASVQVNVDALQNNIPNDAANEPSIAVDPTAPNRMVIGWRQFDTITSNFRQAGVAFSNDGGRTWNNLPPLQAGIFRSDPVLGADETGRIYYFSLRGNFLCDFFLSDDGGATWSAPIPAFGGDKQWFTLDECEGKGRAKVFAAWSVNAGCCGDDAFIRSFDGALTFDTPVEILETPIFGTLVSYDGRVWVAGVDPGDFSRFLVVRSSTASDPLEPITWDFANPVNLNGSMRFATGPNPGGLLGQAWLDVDRSDGPHGGNLYLLASTFSVFGSDPLDVRLARSTDGGETWLPPVKVNDDPPSLFAWQWFGTMDVAPNGRIDVVWNDTRDDPSVTESVLYYASSSDGGQTFSANVALSPPFAHGVGYPQQAKLGDYYQLVSDDVGAHLAYAATFNGEQDVYYLRIGDYDCNGNGVGDAVDIADRSSADCNGNDIPDECEIAAGAAADRNGNGVPDECDVPGDIDGDGLVSFDDLLALLAAWGDCPGPAAPCPADLDADGTVAIGDLVILLANWTG